MVDIRDAVRTNKLEAVTQYLDTDGDVNAKDERGYTPLHLAAEKWRKEVVELLIAEGADLNAKIEGGEHEGDTPLDRAAEIDFIVDLLRKHGGKTGEELKSRKNME